MKKIGPVAVYIFEMPDDFSIYSIQTYSFLRSSDEKLRVVYLCASRLLSI